MEDSAKRALDRLRASDGEALRQLARLVVDEATATPLKEVASPRWIAGQLATALEALSRGDTAREWVERRLSEGRERWLDEQRPLRDWVPKEAEDPLRELLARPWSPDERLTLEILDQPALRNLVREVLEETLTRFQGRVRSLDKAGIGDIGARAAKRGRGLLGGMAQNLGGFGQVARNVGGLTENLVGAVTEEFEHVVQERISEFVATATGEAIKSSARHASDPQYAKAFGELRVAILDVLLDEPIAGLVREADKTRPEELVDVIVAAVRSTVAAPDFVDVTEARVKKALDAAGDGTLGAWLDEVGLRDVWADTTTELVAARLQAVVKTDGFVSWWEQLFVE